MKTLEQYIKTLPAYQNLVSENERYDLARYGFAAFATLTAEKQQQICHNYASIYAPKPTYKTSN